MNRLAGKEITFQVEREGEKVNIKVGPAYHSTFGLRMRIGRIVAVRGPALASGISPRDKKADNEGDTISQVEVTGADGKNIRWTTTRSAVDANVEEKDLDPLKLPFELQQWANSVSGPKKVQVTVKGKVKQAEQQPKPPFTLDWDDSYRFDQEVPLSSAAVSLSGLGIAYQVANVIEGMEPGCHAELLDSKEEFHFQPGDQIVALCGYAKDKDSGELKPRTKTLWFFWHPNAWTELKQGNEWANYFWGFQQGRIEKLLLRVDRGGEKKEVVVTAKSDQSWPLVGRGIRLMPQSQIRKAESMGEAVGMGFSKTFTYIKLIYRQAGA